MQYVQLQQMRDRPALPQRRVDWGEAPDVSQFYGRSAQLIKLERWVTTERCRVLAVVGIGGIGKTKIVTRLTQHLIDTEQFEVVVWRSLQQAPPLQELLTDLMSAIAPEQSLPLRLDATMRQLLQQLRDRRCLLVLDNVEAVLQSNQLVGAYREGYEDYGWLFQQLGAGRHQSSVLLTSRELPVQVSIQAGPAAAVRVLRLEPLSIEEGKSILAAKGLEVQAETLQPVQQLIERYQGNPLALEIVATPIKELFNSNIAAFLAQDTLLFKDIHDLLAHQFARLTPLEQQVMYWLAIEREAVTAAQLQADLLPSITPVQLRYALESLDRRSLIEKNQQNVASALMEADSVSYTQQAVVMEYVTSQLTAQVCQEIKQVQIDCLRSHALLKVQTKDYEKEKPTDATAPTFGVSTIFRGDREQRKPKEFPAGNTENSTSTSTIAEIICTKCCLSSAPAWIMSQRQMGGKGRKLKTSNLASPMSTPSLFNYQHLLPEIILLSVLWYCCYPLSYYDIEEMMQERGVDVDRSTFNRRILKYAPVIDKRIRPYLKPTNDSWRVGKTYILFKTFRRQNGFWVKSSILLKSTRIKTLPIRLRLRQSMPTDNSQKLQNYK